MKNFGNFKKTIPASVNVNEFTTVQIWCEHFSKFIGSAKYQ
ncbi:DM13 domain-containing protein [Pseudomonas paracarnis]|nr:DM13 domain-containing protein [Pseudomonas paracarnis]